MFYPLPKLYARFAITLYCRKIVINQPRYLNTSGPLLLAANHPNSFLDGIILTTLFKHDVYSLARGDAFQNPFINKVLRQLRLLPVYRTSEGVENLSHNYTTFEACQQTFESNGIVLIFSEGRCENEWHLRPLKKGTARLATTAWDKGVALQVLPTAFNYSSFKQFGKTVHLHFGHVITASDIDRRNLKSKQLLQLSDGIQQRLQQLVYEIKDNDTATAHNVFNRNKNTLFYALLCLPALVGWLLHAPLFYPVLGITKMYFKNSGHYDSVLHAGLTLLYPFYLLALVWVLFSFMSPYALLLLAIAPATAWAWVQWSDVLP